MKTFEGRVAAITGASSGIGRALALELAGRGCALALCSRSHPQALKDTARLARAQGVKVTTARVDVARRADVERWAAQVMDQHGRVNLLVNNAGVAFGGSVDGTSIAEFERVMGVNFWGVVYGTKAFLPHLVAGGDGHIVNVASIAGLFAAPGMSAYCASKFAVRGFTESLRQELDLLKNGVSATCVLPGGVKTNIAAAAGRSETLRDLAGGDADQRLKDFERLFITRPERAAQAILTGVRRNARRVLIGVDARSSDVMQRLLPSLYQRLLTTGFALLRR